MKSEAKKFKGGSMKQSCNKKCSEKVKRRQCDNTVGIKSEVKKAKDGSVTTEL